MADDNKDLGDEAKGALDSNRPDNGKTVAIIAHITLIGWIIALVMNNQNKTEFASYYIRQTLGIWIFMFVFSFIPIVGCFAGVFGLVLIILSVINAAGDKMIPTPVVGEYFQDWFKGI
ncbi:MAG: putative membrane protein [Maribacter sp.]|jgi:uncharacterized membrane protein